MPAGKLPYSLAGLAEVNLDHAPKRWSAERCRNSLAKVMSALQVTCSVIKRHHMCIGPASQHNKTGH